jgi:hypothetical protein
LANPRPEEGIGALERAEAEREGDWAVERAAEREREREAREAREGMERERERTRAVYQHQQQVQQHQQTQAQMYSAFEFWGASPPPPPPSSSRAYQLPIQSESNPYLPNPKITHTRTGAAIDRSFIGSCFSFSSWCDAVVLLSVLLVGSV